MRANVMDIMSLARFRIILRRCRASAQCAASWAKARSNSTVSPVCHNETVVLLHVYHMNFEAQPVLLSKHMNINSLQCNQKDS